MLVMPGDEFRGGLLTIGKFRRLEDLENSGS
jgi:hypothetical protein